MASNVAFVSSAGTKLRILERLMVTSESYRAFEHYVALIARYLQ